MQKRTQLDLILKISRHIIKKSQALDTQGVFGYKIPKRELDRLRCKTKLSPDLLPLATRLVDHSSPLYAGEVLIGYKVPPLSLMMLKRALEAL